jgi:hypothetical protein
MLCSSLRAPARLGDPRYVAEPKFDGHRAQIHIASGRTVAAYSRRALSLLGHPGIAWLRDVPWLVDRVVLEGRYAATLAATASRPCWRRGTDAAV